MHQASDKAQEAAQRIYDATHSLPAAVSAGCRVQVAEIVEWLRDRMGFASGARELEQAMKRGEL